MHCWQVCIKPNARACSSDGYSPLVSWEVFSAIAETCFRCVMDSFDVPVKLCVQACMHDCFSDELVSWMCCNHCTWFFFLYCLNSLFHDFKANFACFSEYLITFLWRMVKGKACLVPDQCWMFDCMLWLLYGGIKNHKLLFPLGKHVSVTQAVMTSARYELQPPACFYHEFTFEIVHFSDTVLPSDLLLI